VTLPGYWAFPFRLIAAAARCTGGWHVRQRSRTTDAAPGRAAVPPTVLQPNGPLAVLAQEATPPGFSDGGRADLFAGHHRSSRTRRTSSRHSALA